MIKVHKHSFGVSRRCGGCGRTWGISDSPCDNLVAIRLFNSVPVYLCGKCASQLADNLCNVLGKARIDPSSESYKAGYREGYRDGFRDNYELKD